MNLLKIFQDLKYRLKYKIAIIQKEIISKAPNMLLSEKASSIIIGNRSTANILLTKNTLKIYCSVICVSLNAHPKN
jgi:hypothetical protein